MSSCEIRKLSMILLMLTNYLTLVSAQLQNNPNYSCTSNGNYSSNSTYSTNLNALLNSLSLNISDNGYYTSSVGQNEDTANALALCRADRTLDQCRSCVRSAARDIVQLCPNHRQGVIWSEFCMLRYSNDPIHRTQTNDPGLILRNALNVSNANEFREDRARLLEDLRAQAAHGSSELKVGAGSRNTSDSESQTIYGLVQCTPDLSSEECGGCLTSVAEPMRSCCDISRGVRMLAPSCHIQYELYSFYNETRLKELRVLPPLPPSPPGTDNDNSRSRKKDDNTREIVIIIFVPAAVSLILAAFAAILLRKRMKPRPQEFPGTTYEISMVESLQYDFGQIRAATNDFADANKLGRGGFGAVYKGQLLNGTEIAVKRLAKDSKQGNMEFKNEVLLVAKLQHRNLVRLLGFSIEGTERILIYEFMQNASLDQFIFDSTKRSHLNWDRRYKIIEGIARGLLYLHEDSRFRIIHRDLKVSNILLDGDMNPKIADFGMARLFGQDETQGNTCRIVGTFGYMSPEYAMHGRFSVKSDVFSFGVLILEILSGRRNNCVRNEENMEDLLSFTWKNWQEGTAVNMIDPVVLRNGTRSMHEMLRCIHIGLLCVQQNVAKRPTMTLVVLMLSSSTMMLPVPSEPGFYAASRFSPDVSPFQEYDSIGSNSNRALNVKIGKCEGSSQNDMSVTELYPR